MIHVRNAILAFSLLCFSLAARGGMEKEGYSTKKGLFYTFLEGGHIGFEVREHALDLARHCESDHYVFRLKDQKKFKCRVKLRKNMFTNEAESFGVIEIIEGFKGPNHDMLFDLFTTQRPRNTKWQFRAISPDEMASINDLISSNTTRYGHLPRQLRLGKAVAVTKANATQTTIFVPGKWVRSEYDEAQRHHVFVGTVGNFRYQGEIPDKPVRYFDIDGDSIPEIQTNPTCDGWCIGLWSINAAPKQIASFGGH